MNTRTIQLIYFFTVFGLIAVLAFFILKPFINILILAGTFAVIVYPLYLKMLKLLGQKRPSISAFITIVAVLIIVFVPLTLLGTQVFREAQTLQKNIVSITNQERGILSNLPQSQNALTQKIRERFEGFITEASLDFRAFTQRAVGWLLSNVGNFFESVGKIILAIFLWLFAFYYFLRDGHRLKRVLITLSPLSDKYDEEIMTRIVRSIKSVVGGSLIVALIQGLLAGVGFAIFGVPHPSIWGALAVLAALIPTVGTALVTLPAVIYLAFLGNTGAMIGLLVWSMVIVAGIDNILRPKLIERGIKIHPLIILLSVLGGIALFGPIGFLTGPIVMSLLSELFSIYQQLVVKRES